MGVTWKGKTDITTFGIKVLDDAMKAIEQYVEPVPYHGIIDTMFGPLPVMGFKTKVPITYRNLDTSDDNSPLRAIAAPPFVRVEICSDWSAKFGVGKRRGWSDPWYWFYTDNRVCNDRGKQFGYFTFDEGEKTNSIGAMLMVLWANGFPNTEGPLRDLIFMEMNRQYAIETGRIDLAGVEGIVDRCHLTLIADDQRLVNRHVLLAGPPGCGKSEIVKQLVAMTPEWVHIPLDPEVNWNQFMTGLNKLMVFLGKRVMIVADEIDEIGLSRDKDHNRVFDLLRVLDGVGDLGHIKFVATTNRPGDLDPALKRVGRFGPMVMMEPPDDLAARKIIQYYERLYNAQIDELELLANLDGAVGADIRAAFENCIIFGKEITTETVVDELMTVLDARQNETRNYL